MRILHVLPGSGDRFYCENCVRDGALVRALREAGQDVRVAPLYLPRFIDVLDGVPAAPVFYGGINACLQQKFDFFRKTPRWIDRLFDAPPLLRLAARRAGSVRASELGEMTLSVLKGAGGSQAKELERLLRWLETGERPDVAHLSSPLLLGIGEAIQKRFAIPIVCSLQDEDAWVDAMDEPFRSRCWEAMREGVRHVDAFIAVSRYFAGVMRERMKMDQERLHVVQGGVDLRTFSPPARPPEVPTLGFLSRLSESLGLGLLADAFLQLKRTDPLRRLRLHLCGGMTGDDKPFLKRLRRKFLAAGVDGDVRVYEKLDAAARKEFLASLSVLSVPTPGGAAFGTYLLEALASGVPVVQPRVGSFPEVVEPTGGGILYEPNDAETLARSLREVLVDPDRRALLARRGREAVVKGFSLERMAKDMLEVYQRVVARRQGAER